MKPEDMPVGATVTVPADYSFDIMEDEGWEPCVEDLSVWRNPRLGLVATECVNVSGEDHWTERANHWLIVKTRDAQPISDCGDEAGHLS